MKVINIGSLCELMVIFLAVTLEGQPSLNSLLTLSITYIHVIPCIQELTFQVMTYLVFEKIHNINMSCHLSTVKATYSLRFSDRKYAATEFNTHKVS